ncbi:MAG: DsrE family protein [Candidatus Rokubacteria bacterium]|nr:DsrE family protein [Candidatus Rokubacteria bacterium]
MREVRSLAVIVSGGSFNNLVQAATLLMVAAGSGIAARVFFRDEAVLKVTKAGATEVNLSDAYRGDEGRVRARLEAQGLLDLPALFREIKEVGDVRLYVCSSSLAICGARPDDLIPEIDEVRGLTAFLLEDVAAADRVLTF